MEQVNFEIKARCSNHDYIRKILKENHLKFIGVDNQIDTYFKVSNGRLKLREGNIENLLIYYERENKAGPKQSNVILMPTVLKGDVLKEILTKSLDVLVVVNKEREIYSMNNVKFHLDKVSGLGNFVEIESSGRNESFGSILEEQCKKYMDLFKIKESDLVAGSYSDMILAKK